METGETGETGTSPLGPVRSDLDVLLLTGRAGHEEQEVKFDLRTR